jgi:uracil DNA glycosylase
MKLNPMIESRNIIDEVDRPRSLQCLDVRERRKGMLQLGHMLTLTKLTTIELREGEEYIKSLINLLPELKVVVLVGKKASRVMPYLKAIGITVLTSSHPSPIVKAAYPQAWNAIPLEWAKVKEFLT